MSPADRHSWIKAYLRARPKHDAQVDVLNAQFVHEYILATKAPFAWMAYGAHKCPQLGRDLSAMYKAGELGRAYVGMGPGSRNQGFPSWVYVYELY
jgi:hypothetical protein